MQRSSSQQAEACYKYSSEQVGFGYDTDRFGLRIFDDGSAVISRQVKVTACRAVQQLNHYLQVPIARQTDPFDEVSVERLDASRGEIGIRWRLDFKPSLRRRVIVLDMRSTLQTGEFLEYEIVERLAPGSIALLLDQLENGETENKFSLEVSWPTRLLLINVHTPVTYAPSQIDSDVWRGPSRFSVGEVARIARTSLKKQNLVESSGERTQKFWFEYQYPPQGLVYALKWVPPVEVLSDQAQGTEPTSIISLTSPSDDTQRHQPEFVTWLHISDLHYREEHGYQIDIIEKALLEDIKTTIDEKGLAPDFVAFTGDLVFSGQEKQYSWVEGFLSRLLQTVGITDKNRIFLIPGNHDIDRGRIDKITARGALDALKNSEDIAEFLGPQGNRASVFAKFKPYFDFFNRFHNTTDLLSDKHYFWTRRIRVGKTVIGVLGINSTWMSGFRKDQNDKVIDEGALVLGERQVYEAIQKVEQDGGADILVAAMHHPLDVLGESSDKQLSLALLRRKCDFILHGHMHYAEVTQVAALDGDTIVIPAGACYDRRERPSGYNFVRFDVATGQGTVYLRRYSNRQGAWLADTDATGDATAGESVIRLQQRKTQG